MSSDTPRTDAAAIEACGNCEDDDMGQAVVSIRFARQLERELATVTAERDAALKDAARAITMLPVYVHEGCDFISREDALRAMKEYGQAQAQSEQTTEPTDA